MLSGTDFFLEALCLGIYSNDDIARALLTTVVKLCRTEQSKTMFVDDELCVFYIDMIEEITAHHIDFSNDAETTALLMRFKQADILNKDPLMLDHLKKLIEHRASISQQRIESLKRKVKNWIIWKTADKLSSQMKRNLWQCERTTDPNKHEELLKDVVSYSRELTEAYENQATLNDDIIEFINMSDKNSVKVALESRKRKRDENVFKMGLQGLNRTFGHNSGIVRGEFVAFGALPGHYKSGMLMSIARWIATLNNPGPVPGKPAILFITLENEAFENSHQWFREAYINAYHSNPDGLTDEEIVKYVTDVYNKNGFDLLVYRKLGEFFGFDEYVRLVSSLEEKGYSIVASIIDYITLMMLNENDGNPAKQLQKLAHRVASFGKHRGITTITAVQLGGGGVEMDGESSQAYKVKKYTIGQIADCKGLYREFDYFAFLHIEENQRKVRYLTCYKKKHRYVSDTPPEHNFFAYRFSKLGILDDVSGKDRSVSDIYTDGDDAKLEDVSDNQLFGN